MKPLRRHLFACLALLIVACIPAAAVAETTTKPGYLDQAFGGGGIVDVKPVPSNSRQSPAGIVVASDGGPVVATMAIYSNHHTDMMVSKYKRNGELDSGFGKSGRSLSGSGGPTGKLSAVPVDIAKQPDGKFVVFGTLTRGLNTSKEANQLLVVRFTRHGAIDRSFGRNGRFTGTLNVRRLVKQLATRIVIDQKGRILLAATAITASGHDDFAIMRLTKTGRLDRGFGNRGSAIPKVANEPSYDELNAMLPLRDGRILLGGESCGVKVCRAKAVLARLSPTGKLDKAFGSGGVRTYRFGPGASQGLYGNSIDDFAPLIGNKIAVAATVAGPNSGGMANPVDVNLAVAQFDLNGNLDATFGQNGISLETAWGAWDEARSSGRRILRGEDGRLYLSGAIVQSAQGRLNDFGCLLVRFSASGDFDRSYGHDGAACAGREIYPLLEPINYSISYGFAIARSSGGTFIAAASRYPSPRIHLALLRFND